MQNLVSQNPQREFVWTIQHNQETCPKNKANTQNQTKINKEPTKIKELIEQTFQNLSLQLLDKVKSLEKDLKNLRLENQKLQAHLNKIVLEGSHAENAPIS